MNDFVIALAALVAGSVATLLIVIGLFWDFSDLGTDTGGTSYRRGPYGDPWRDR